MRNLLVAALFLVPLLLPVPVGAQGSWQEQLAVEIEIAEGCVVQYLSQVLERPDLVMAKVHCADGRVFDASRADPLAPFEFRECEASRERQAC